MKNEHFIDAMAHLDEDLLTEHFERKCPTKIQKIRKYALAVAAYAAACLVVVMIIPFIIGNRGTEAPNPGKDPGIINTDKVGSTEQKIDPPEENPAKKETVCATATFLGCDFIITLDKDYYTLDDTITATVTLTNNSDKAVGLWQGYLGDFLDKIEFYEDGELRLSYSSDWDRCYAQAIKYGPFEPGGSITHTVKFTPGAPNDTSDPVANTTSIWEITASVMYYENVTDDKPDYEKIQTATVTIEVPHEGRPYGEQVSEVFDGIEVTLRLDKESYTVGDTISVFGEYENVGDTRAVIWSPGKVSRGINMQFYENGVLRPEYALDSGWEDEPSTDMLTPGSKMMIRRDFIVGEDGDPSALWEIVGTIYYTAEYPENPFDAESITEDMLKSATVTIEVPHEEGITTESATAEPPVTSELPATTHPPESEPPAVIPPLEEGQSISGDFVVNDTAAVKYFGRGGDVVIPEGIEFLENGIFDDCYTITSITFPSSLHGQALDGGPDRDNLDSMVAHIPALTHYYFAEGNPKYYSYDGLILSSAGEGNVYIAWVPPGRTEITVPSFVNYGVNGGQNLENVYVEDGHKTFSSYGGILFSKDRTELSKLPPKKTVFSMPPEFTQSTFFWHDVCKNIEWYEVDPANKKYCSIDGVLYEKKGDTVNLVHVPYNKTSYTFPDNCYNTWKNPFFGNTGIREIVVPLHFNVDYSAWNMFAGCRNLESVTIHRFTDTAEGMFLGCTSLKSIYLPETIKVIRSSCFNSCSSLQTVTIPSTVTKIEGSAFANCTSLVDVYIPDSVTEIDKNAFGRYADGSLSQSLIIHCSAGSYAAKYAAENGINWTAS